MPIVAIYGHIVLTKQRTASPKTVVFDLHYTQSLVSLLTFCHSCRLHVIDKSLSHYVSLLKARFSFPCGWMVRFFVFHQTPHFGVCALGSAHIS